MSEVDWTKPVEVKYGGEWNAVEVLWHDERFPNDTLITWGAKVAACRAADDRDRLRNVPPPPPEVWIVWEHFGRGDWYVVGRYDNQQTADIVVKAVGNSVVKRHAQKVTCDAPR